MAENLPSQEQPEEISLEEDEKRRLEQEWLNFSEANKMLRFLENQEIVVSDRQARLLAISCCNRLNDLLDDRSKKALEVAELYADGNANIEDLNEARRIAREVLSNLPFDENGSIDLGSIELTATQQALEAINCSLDASARLFLGSAIIRSNTAFAYAYDKNQSKDKANSYSVNLLRDIVGNPFAKEPIVFDENWRTSDVLAIAKGIYEEKAFERMPILADALQDAGCDNEEILNHCRKDLNTSECSHVRGCWVIDLILGK